MLAHPQTMAQFSAWANRRIYGACEALSPAALAEDRGAFFGSILGTLNHILLVDLLYRERLEGTATRFRALDEILHAELGPLARSQAAQDAWYIERLAGVTEADLERPVGFYTLLDEPEYWEVPHRTYFTNLFQHQVHHRGHVHNMLSQAGLDPPPIGFIEYEVELGERVVRRKG